MTTPKATHPPAPLVPARLKKEDWVFLTGPNAGVFSGLYKFKFENLDGAENATLPITRGDPDRVYFKSIPHLRGTMK